MGAYLCIPTDYLVYICFGCCVLIDVITYLLLGTYSKTFAVVFWIGFESDEVCRLALGCLSCQNIKERCFILTVQTYNDFLTYTNKIDEMHEKSMKCILNVISQ